MMKVLNNLVIVFVLFAPCLFGQVAANECASPDGECGDETSVLLQSKVSVDSVEDNSAEELSFSEAAVKQRYASRVRLVLEKDLSRFDSMHYRAYDSSQTVDDNIRAAFEAFLQTSDLSKELTVKEGELYFARFKEMLKVDLKHDHVAESPTAPDWAREVASALQHEKPVVSEAVIAALTAANLGYEVKLQEWMENLSQDDLDRQTGTHVDQEDLLLTQTSEVHRSRFDHLLDVTSPASFDSATQWSQCSGVIGRIHNQGTCGSCWAFGALSALDSHLCIKTNGGFSGSKAMLSRGYATSCSYASRDGCQGGWPTAAYAMYKNSQTTAGVSGGTSGCSPYFGHGEGTDHFQQGASAPPCPTQCGNAFTARAISADRYHFPDMSYGSVYRSNGQAALETSMKAAISQGGPVAYAVLADNGFMAYSSGAYQGDCTANPNHAVTAIGYDAAGVESLNSWGPNWGRGGAFKVTWCMVFAFMTLDLGSDMSQAPNPIVPGESSGPTQAPTQTPTSPTRAPGGSGPWSVTSGPCTVDAAGCIMSANYGTTNYGPNEKCDITVQANSPAIEVMDFNVEATWDKLSVNDQTDGTQYSLHGLVPTTQMQWISDSSVTNTGWKLCPRAASTPTPAPTPAPTAAPTPAPTAAPTTVAPTGAPPAPEVPVTKESLAAAFAALASDDSFLTMLMNKLRGPPQ